MAATPAANAAEYLHNNYGSDYKIEGYAVGATFICTIIFKSKRYVGYGQSKSESKQNACEEALRDNHIDNSLYRRRRAHSDSIPIPKLVCQGSGCTCPANTPISVRRTPSRPAIPTTNPPPIRNCPIKMRRRESGCSTSRQRKLFPSAFSPDFGPLFGPQYPTTDTDSHDEVQ